MNIYNAPVKSKNDLDSLKKLIYIYSCYKAQRDESKKLRPRLIDLLSLYMKYGYSSGTKSKATEIFDVKRAAIDSMNLELRRAGYLVMNKMNQNISHLNEELEQLKEYFESLDGGPVYFLFNIEVDA